MNNKAKAATLILIVLIIISFSLAGGIYYLLQNEKAKSTSLQVQLEDTITKYKKAETELGSVKDKISMLALQVKEAQNKLETLNKDLQQEKTAKQEALSKVDQLTGDLEQLKSSKSDLENKLSQSQEDAKKIQNQLKELRSQKTELESKLKELESKTQGVELGKIIVNPEGAIVAPQEASGQSQSQPLAVKTEKPTLGKEGKVLVVNKDYNFVVLNLGSKDGVDIADMFTVYHNNKNVGDVKVEKVHESMAAAGFVNNDMKDKVSEGDKVVQKVK